MRIYIIGSKTWTNFKIIDKYLSKLSDNDIIIHGAFDRAQRMADYWARKRFRHVVCCSEIYKYYYTVSFAIFCVLKEDYIFQILKPDLILGFVNTNDHVLVKYISSLLANRNIPVKIITETGKYIALDKMNFHDSIRSF